MIGTFARRDKYEFIILIAGEVMVGDHHIRDPYPPAGGYGCAAK